MTASQRARLCRIVEDLCELREECSGTDRLELGGIVLELLPAIVRPSETEPTGAFDECIK